MTMPQARPEFFRSIELARLGASEAIYLIVATPTERDALARRFDLRSLSSRLWRKPRMDRGWDCAEALTAWKVAIGRDIEYLPAALRGPSSSMSFHYGRSKEESIEVAP